MCRAQTKHLPGRALLLACLAGLSCGSAQAFIEVPVSGLGATVVSLRVTSTLDGIKAQSPETFSVQQANPFTFTLGLPQGASGAFVVQVDALDQKDCLVSSGQVQAAIAGAAVQIVPISMIPLYALTLTRDGSGNGTLTTDITARGGPGSTCPTSLFSSGTKVKITARPSADSLFTGWTGTCTPSGADCLQTLSAATTLTARFSRWAAVTGVNANSLSGVFATSKTDIWAVGVGGTLLHGDGTRWTAFSSGTQSDLYGVWANGAKDAWAVGAAGTMDRWDGVRWTASSSGTLDFYAVWGDGATDVWAVGAAGTIVHWDGTQLMAQTSTTTKPLRGVWGKSGTKEAWAVGDQGTIVHTTDGIKWVPVLSGTASKLAAIWGSSGTDVWTVGEGGTMLHWDGTSWNLQNTVTSNNLNGVWGSGRTDVWAVGDKGTILHLAGANFGLVPGPLTVMTAAVSGSSSTGGDDIWAVADKGTILHYVP